jgi:hypothetical protein
MSFTASQCAAPSVQAVDGDFEALGYSYALSAANQFSASFGERGLWCAVIEQAFVDLGAIAPAQPESLPAKPKLRAGNVSDDAARWLLRDRKDFEQVCMLAGVSASVIRQAALAFYTLHRHASR